MESECREGTDRTAVFLLRVEAQDAGRNTGSGLCPQRVSKPAALSNPRKDRVSGSKNPLGAQTGKSVFLFWSLNQDTNRMPVSLPKQPAKFRCDRCSIRAWRFFAATESLA
jgi:hypothetical protein